MSGEHGYGMRPPQSEGWAPGYCWCGAPGYDGFAGHRGCDQLAALFGRRVTSHGQARELGLVLGMEWDGRPEPTQRR